MVHFFQLSVHTLTRCVSVCFHRYTVFYWSPRNGSHLRLVLPPVDTFDMNTVVMQFDVVHWLRSTGVVLVWVQHDCHMPMVFRMFQKELRSRELRAALKLGFHIRGKRKRLAAAACGYGMRYANDLIPYIRLPMRLHSLFLFEWKETPNSDVIFTDFPTSAIRFCTFCRMNRYLERFSLPHTQPFAAAR